MNIESMLLGHKARADEDKLNDIRQDCQEMMAVIEGKDVWSPFYKELESQVDSIDIYIKWLRKEDEWAEQNAKYREDRPNA